MADLSRRRLPLPLRLYIHARMFWNAYKVTRRGLKHQVMDGDVITLQLTFTVVVDWSRGVFRA